jgi:hypothetical protein
MHGPTPKQARGPRWLRVGPGLYVPTGTSRSPEQRTLEASVRLPVTGAITGWAACRLHGAAFLDGLDAGGRTELPVPLLLAGGNIRGGPDVLLLRHRVAPDEIVCVAGIPCAIPERATYDAMLIAGELRAAVRVLDMALAGEITSLSRMDRYLTGRSRTSPLVRAARALASERSWSPRETDLRLVWVLDAGLPKPRVNWPVHDLRGRLLGIPDLFDPDSGHAAEYDGADHRGRQRHARDVDRESDFRDVGCEFTRVVGPNMEQPGRVAERLLAAHSRAELAVTEERLWRLGDPGPSLDERIAERETRQAFHEHWENTPVPDISGW